MAYFIHGNLQNPETIELKDKVVEIDRGLVDLPYSSGRRNRAREVVNFEGATVLILAIDGQVRVDTRSTLAVRPLNLMEYFGACSSNARTLDSCRKTRGAVLLVNVVLLHLLYCSGQ